MSREEVFVKKKENIENLENLVKEIETNASDLNQASNELRQVFETLLSSRVYDAPNNKTQNQILEKLAAEGWKYISIQDEKVLAEGVLLRPFRMAGIEFTSNEYFSREDEYYQYYLGFGKRSNGWQFFVEKRSPHSTIETISIESVGRSMIPAIMSHLPNYLKDYRLLLAVKATVMKELSANARKLKSDISS